MSNCAQCTSGTTCNSCYSGYEYRSGECKAKVTCGDRTYLDVASNTCQNCIDNCILCSSGTACTSCDTDYEVYQSTCRKKLVCPSGTYPDYVGYVCLDCSRITNCQQCSSSSTCTACQNGYKVRSGLCVIDCLVPNCDYCIKQDTCDTCSSGYFSQGDSFCAQCGTGCRSCTDKSFCKSCFNCYALKDSTCYPIPNCGAGTLLVGVITVLCCLILVL